MLKVYCPNVYILCKKAYFLGLYKMWTFFILFFWYQFPPLLPLSLLLSSYCCLPVDKRPMLFTDAVFFKILLCFTPSTLVSFWPCLQNLIKTLQNEAITPLISNITLKRRPCTFGQSLGWPIVRSISHFFGRPKKNCLVSETRQKIFCQSLIFLFTLY